MYSLQGTGGLWGSAPTRGCWYCSRWRGKCSVSTLVLKPSWRQCTARISCILALFWKHLIDPTTWNIKTPLFRCPCRGQSVWITEAAEAALLNHRAGRSNTKKPSRSMKHPHLQATVCKRFLLSSCVHGGTLPWLPGGSLMESSSRSSLEKKIHGGLVCLQFQARSMYAIGARSLRLSGESDCLLSDCLSLSLSLFFFDSLDLLERNSLSITWLLSTWSVDRNIIWSSPYIYLC